ncbi:MAG: sulfatase, partial [Lentisphaerae bacterium]|nr:sulfatase [Lentisphaerota bacterium]MBT7845904.1 sulfatase [Lentisphaerota bacterium]
MAICSILRKIPMKERTSSKRRNAVMWSVPCVEQSRLGWRRSRWTRGCERKNFKGECTRMSLIRRSCMRITFALIVFPFLLFPATCMGEVPKLWVHPYVCKGGFFGPLRDDYVKVMTDASQWKGVLARTHAVGFHMALLGRYHDKAVGKTPYRATDEQLRALAAFYKKHNLKVNIEIGGVRFRPAMVRAGRAGVGRRYTREVQIPLLERWRKAGGSIDYLTTDHAVMMRLGEQKAGKTKDGVAYSVDELIGELSEALAELHGAFPEAELGIAESLGHFRVKAPDDGRTYPLRPPDPHGAELSVFLKKLQSSAAAAGVRIHNFMIDHQIQAAHRDATGKIMTVGGPFILKREYVDRAAEIPLDLGRAAAAAKIARSTGMRVIFQVTPGAYGFGLKGDTDARNDHRAAQAVRRMAKECAAADIRPDAIIFECWQPHPSRTGPGTREHSFMHNVRQSFAQAPASVAATHRPPNFVFVLADDLGWKDLGCYGSSFHESPHIDRLAAQGMRFTDAYSAAPLCSATRASILSGWAPARQHIHGVTPSVKGQNPWGFHDYASWQDEAVHQYPPVYAMTIPKQLKQFPLKRTTFAERLKERNYKTGFIGKWHLGPNRDMGPKQQGFDYTFAVSERGYPPTYHAPYKRGNYEFQDFQAKTAKEYLTDRLTDEAVGFIEKNKDQTFCLYLSHYAVHSPWESRDDYTKHFKGTRKPDAAQNNAAYAGMIKSLDDSVGRLMQTVEKLGLDENTVFVFISDNGAKVTNAHGRKPGETNKVTSVAPLRGEKGLIYEGGIRVPFIVRWKGMISRSVSDVPVVSTDLYPTLLELAGLQVKEDNPVDGTSLVPLLTGKGGLDRKHISWFMP